MPPRLRRNGGRGGQPDRGRNGVPCVILRAMSDNADESGYEVLVVKQFSITEYVKTATEIVANMIESL